MMKIPYSTLSDEALKGVVEEYVSREGTDYGENMFTFAEKIEHVMKQIVAGDVLIEFDADSQSCQLITKEHITADKP